MSSHPVRLILAASVSLMLLAGCGGHSSHAAQAASARDASSPSASTDPTDSGPLTTANVYDRALKATKNYQGLTGTVEFSETTPGGSVLITGSFQTNVADFADHTTNLDLQIVGRPLTLGVRAIGSVVYYRQGRDPWKNVTTPTAANRTAVTAGQLDMCAQLLAGLEPLEYSNLLERPADLKQSPAPRGNSSFSGVDDLGITTESFQYDPELVANYEQAGIASKSFTTTLDAQARPVALQEHLASSKLTIDYQLTITGYSAAKTVAPI